ncbi:MAG: hypothetical protein IPI44_14520 [Sulfuritalea sp.]|nr:hypothetical protein [Sulfuritalea sp.]
MAVDETCGAGGCTRGRKFTSSESPGLAMGSPVSEALPQYCKQHQQMHQKRCKKCNQGTATNIEVQIGVALRLHGPRKIGFGQLWIALAHYR